MTHLIIAVVATVVAGIWTVITLVANAMSDARTVGFQGGGTLILAWLSVLYFWFSWYVG
jgi:hypothetical protein